MKDENTKKKYMEQAEQIIRRVYTKENQRKMKQAIREKDRWKKQYSRGGMTQSRGYYSPSLIESLIVTNVTRGKLLKRLTAKSRPDYCYYFNGDSLVLIQANPFDEKKFHRYEWIYREGNHEYTILSDGYKFSMLTISIYEENRIISNAFLSNYFAPDDFELVLEEYKYNQDKQLISANMTFVCINPGLVYEDAHELEFFYDKNGALIKCIRNGDESGDDPVRISPAVEELITGIPKKSKRKSLTEPILTCAMKKIAKEWKGEDIYAISIFISHDGDEVTDFAMSCNHEENQVGEERWNYACWEQEEESLLPLLDESETDWEQLLKLTASVVRKLQEEKFFSKTFGREIAVIIHGYEYEELELAATREANPNGQADEFFEALKLFV